MTTINTATLAELVEIKIGRTPSRREPRYWRGNQAWLTISDYDHGDVVSTTKEGITPDAIAESGIQIHPEGSLVMSFKLTIGKMAFLAAPMATNEAIAALIPKRCDEVCERYLYHYLSQYRFDHLVDRAAKGRTLNKAKLAKIEVRFPSFTEQRRIAAILDKADAIRRKREQALALADDLLQSTFLEMFGDPVTNPKGWPVEELGEWISHSNNGLARRRKTSANEGSVVLRLQDVRANWIDYSDCNRIALEQNERGRFLLEKGDLLFVRVNGNRDYVGRCSVFRGFSEPVYHNDHLIRLRLREQVSSDYLSFLFNLPAGRHLLSNAVKTSAGQYTVSQDGLKKLKIPLPSPSQQSTFLKFAENLSGMREKLARADADADQLFASLSQRAFRGEL